MMEYMGIRLNIDEIALICVKWLKYVGISLVCVKLLTYVQNGYNMMENI